MNLFDLPIETAETTTVATLDEGDFVEGIVAHPNGVRYATGPGSGRIVRIAPEGDQSVVWDFSP